MTADRAPDFDVRGLDVPHEIFPRGRIRFSLGARSTREIARRRAAMHELRRAGEWTILRALSDGLITVAEVARRMRNGGVRALPEIRTDVEVRVSGSVPTFAEEASEYLTWYESRRGPQSVSNVRSRLKLLGEYHVDGGRPLGDLKMPQVLTEHAEEAVQGMSDSPGTQHASRAAGSGLYSWSIEREADRARAEHRAPRWDANPFQGVDLPDRSARVETASDDQVRALINHAQPYQRAYVRAFVQVGLRLDELIHTRMHLDLDPRDWRWTIQPRAADPRCTCLQCKGRGWSPKSSNSVRSFIVPREAGLLRRSVEGYLRASPAEAGDFVFRNPRTERVWTAGALRLDFRRLCEAAGVRYGRDVPGGITVHTLRHTCATNLVRAGVRESVIAALLGDTVDTVVTTYVHLTAEDLAEGIARGPQYE